MRCLLAGVSLLVLAGVTMAQDFSVAVPPDVRRHIGAVFPERSNATTAYLSASYATNLVFSMAATARIIFIKGGNNYQNSLGYFTYTDNPNGTVTINSADMLINNASPSGGVQRGDGFELKDAGGSVRTFGAGDKLGFFMIADGQRQQATIVNGWTYGFSDGLGTVPSADPSVNAQRGRGCYCSVARLNPEIAEGEPDKARHMVMVQMPGVSGFLGGVDYVVCGWEELRRTGKSDDDFNELVFVIDATPLSSVGSAALFRYERGDPDGDGVRGLNDAFPNDSTRANLERIPSVGHSMLAFEDKYPERGDADFNDAVLAYTFELASNADGNITDILGTFALIARGATYDACFGLHLPGLPSTAAGSINVERFTSGSTASFVEPTRTVQSIIANATRRIVDIVASTSSLLPPPNGFQFSNTLFASGVQGAGSARVHIHFDTPISPRLLGRPPYDAFLYVANPVYPNTRVDIHLPGWPSFADRPSYLPTEQGLTTFIDKEGFPWALEVPNGWRFPMEIVSIDSAYPEFLGWRESLGTINKQWFMNPNTSSGLVGPSLAELVPVRAWTITIPR